MPLSTEHRGDASNIHVEDLPQDIENFKNEYFGDGYPDDDVVRFVKNLQNYSLDFHYQSRSILVVTFEWAGGLKLRPDRHRLGWGVTWLLKQGVSILAVKPLSTDWFRKPDLHAFMRALQHAGFFRAFEKVVFYGASMGGYGALAFADAAPGSIVLAYSPQTTLRRSETPWEPRFREARNEDWDGDFSDAAASRAASRVVVVYDSFNFPDRQHAKRLPKDNLTLIRIPWSGHMAVGFASQMRLLSDIFWKTVDGDLDVPKLAARIRARRNIAEYWLNMSRWAKSEGAAFRCWEMARDLEPEAARTQFNRLYITYKWRRFAEALALALPFLEHKTYGSAWLYETIANCYKETGNTADALLYARHGLEKFPSGVRLQRIVNSIESKAESKAAPVPTVKPKSVEVPPDLERHVQTHFPDRYDGDKAHRFVKSLQNYSLDFHYQTKSILVVTFEWAGGSRLRPDRFRLGWGVTWLLKQNVSILAVKPMSADWFRKPDLHAFLRTLQHEGFFRAFEKVVFYGASMGGYGALAFADVAPGSIVLAYSPQTTLRRSETPWEPRFHEARNEDWDGDFSDAAASRAASRVVVVYDSFNALDRRHVERLPTDNLTPVKIPMSGHMAVVFASRMHLLSDIFWKTVDGDLHLPELAAKIRTRRGVPEYWFNLCRRAKSESAAIRCWEMARELEPDSPRTRFNRLYVSFKWGRFADALPLALPFLDHKTYGSAWLYEAIAICCRETGNRADALRYARLGTEKFPAAAQLRNLAEGLADDA